MNDADLESLVAYLDDELPPEAKRALEARLDAEPELADALASLQANDRLVARSLDDAALGHGIEALRGRVRQALSGAPAPKGIDRPRFVPWRAIAASFAALVVGVGIGYLVAAERFETRLIRLDSARLADSRAIEAAVARALEKQLSGRPVHWQSQDGGRTAVITPVRTFRSEAGQWCREFVRVVEGPTDREVLRGIACREGEGRWRPRIWRHERASG